jgi:hypothetical protein
VRLFEMDEGGLIRLFNALAWKKLYRVACWEAEEESCRMATSKLYSIFCRTTNFFCSAIAARFYVALRLALRSARAMLA